MTTASRKKRIGPKQIDLTANPPPAENVAATEPAPTPTLYVVYYFEDKNGGSGITNVVIDQLIAVRTQAHILGIIAAIKNNRSDDPDFYTEICVINWSLLEG